MAGAIEQARDEGRTLLNEVESKQLLEAAGIPTSGAHLAGTADGAARLADQLGYPAVLKVISADISHKSDVGGVALNLQDAGAVRDAFNEMLRAVQAAQPSARIDGVSVQRQASPGTEVIVGMTKDPQFGPVIMFGLGGVLVEVLRDVAFRLVPLDPRDAREMIREIKGFAVLEGYRGAQPADLDALEALILNVSRFIEAHPEVEELDLNPVFVYPDGALVVDARVIVSPAISNE
ncbi:MAG: acetate--CoA ligase family protein [Dehalococcoidia bacterium]